MQAVVKTRSAVALAEVARPVLHDAQQVRIRVARVGVCRTDLHVAYGRLPCVPPRILGHELAGVVTELGSAVRGLELGMRVTVAPLLACAQCRDCAQGQECRSPRMLGVDCDGAFAQELVVPARAVFRVPDSMSFERAAYVEPVAASMAVLSSGIRAEQTGAVVGSGRIAELTRRILAAQQFAAPIVQPEQLDNHAHYDWLIDTTGSSVSLQRSMLALRHGGTLVLKSRPAAPLAFDVALAVQRELTLKAVRYAPFADAISLLARRDFQVEELFGEAHSLAAFEHVFARAEQGESNKQFFAPNPELR